MRCIYKIRVLHYIFLTSPRRQNFSSVLFYRIYVMGTRQQYIGVSSDVSVVRDAYCRYLYGDIILIIP